MAQCARPKGPLPSGPAKSNGDNNRSKKKRGKQRQKQHARAYFYLFIFFRTPRKAQPDLLTKRLKGAAYSLSFWARCTLCSGKTKRKAKSEKEEEDEEEEEQEGEEEEGLEDGREG